MRELLNKIFLPQYNRTIRLQKDETLLELFQREGFYLQSDCAGNGTCGKCKIQVDGCKIPHNEAEKKHLSPEQQEKGFRLSCQLSHPGDCQVTFIADDADADQILTEGTRRHIRLDPAVQEIQVEVEQPDLGHPAFDVESLKKSIPEPLRNLRIPLNLLEKVPGKLRENEYRLSVIVNEENFVDLRDAESKERIFGLAVDIGTTTLVVKLLDLETGIIRAVTSGLNPQQRIGADVISRISYSQRNERAFKKLQKMLIDRLNKMIGTISLSAGISTQQVLEVSIVGNTVMGHLLFGLDATHLALSPYTPVVKSYPKIIASEIGLGVNPNAAVYLLPNIGRFVGGDTTGVILATGTHDSSRLTLLIDIGTNGEIVFGNKEKLLATSTAAGPAFEGARIKFGMRAAAGAIDRAKIRNGELSLHTIEGGSPKGICGSGIISLIGELLNGNIITWTGQLSEKDDGNKLADRLQMEQAETIFMLHQSNDEKVYLSQRDIREIQLAKSAIRTGINLLLDEFGVTEKEIDRILLAGAFGNFLDREQAIRIGLLPDVAIDKIRFVGNAACAGAELCLLSRQMRRKAEQIAEKTLYFEIATHPKFYDEYTENMLFGKE